MITGLFRRSWDDVEDLNLNFSGHTTIRRRQKTEEEGVVYKNHYCTSPNIHCISWLKDMRTIGLKTNFSMRPKLTHYTA